MTQSAQTKKSPSKPKVVVTEPELKEPPVREEPKTEVDEIIERLRTEKPQTYDQYIKAIEAKKLVSVYPDLTLRIGQKMPEVNTAGGAFPEETPAFNEQDQAILDGQDPQELEQEGELIGGKFRSADDLLQAYQELEKKLGEQPQAEVEEYYEEDPDIEGVQVPDDAQEQSLPAAEESTILETIGGAENLTTIREWAQAELDQDEIDSYNEEVNSGDYTRARNAVQSMFFAYNQAVGQEPSLLGGRISNNSTDVYRSVQEVEAAMNDPRYLHDTAYTQDVEEKVSRSDVLTPRQANIRKAYVNIVASEEITAVVT